MPKKRLTVNLIGIDCDSCERTITRAVKDVKGVDRIVSSPLLNKIFLYVDEGADVNELKRRIRETGVKSRLTSD